MRVSKHIHKGGRITDLNLLVTLAKERKSVVMRMGYSHFVRPAAFMLNWTVAQILKTELFYAVNEKELKDAEFES